MEIIKRTRIKFGNWFLKYKMKSVQRKKAVYNFNTANTAAIIFTAIKSENFRKINDFLNYISNKNIKVYALAYVNSKDIPNEITAHSKINFFTKRDVNFFYIPKNSLVDSFINKEFDLLIDLSTDNHFPVKVVNNLSKASFKVGLDNDPEKDFDLMLSLKDKNDLEYFIEQLKYYLNEINTKKNLAL